MDSLKNLIIAKGPLDYYPLDESAGTTLYDWATGSAVNGGTINTTGVSFQHEVIAGTLATMNLSGSGSTPNPSTIANVNDHSSWSAICFFKLDALPATSSSVTVWSQVRTGVPESMPRLYVYNDAGTGTIYAQYADSSFTNRQITGATEIVAGTTYFAAMIYDGTDFKLYINNALDGTYNSLTQASARADSFQYFGSYDGSTQRVDGTLAHFALFGKELTTTDLTEIWEESGLAPASWQTQSSVMTIDETAVFSDVLTPAEIANLYHSYLSYGTGSQLIEDTSNDTHGLAYSFDFVTDTDYTLTISAKAGTRDYIHLSLPASAFGTEQRAAFNLSDGTSASESGSPTIAMTSTGDGWYRCSISSTSTASATDNLVFYVSDGTLSYLGNGYYAINVNYAQLEESGSYTTYQPNGESQEKQSGEIAEVPGTGPILGIHYYNDAVYIFRNATDNATAVMWASSTSGWVSKKTGLTPNGKYRCVNYTFGSTQKMYVVSGVHKAAEWDGTTWTDITTGMSPDEPEHVIGHKKHLFLAFGNSVQHSPLGDPTGTWSVLTGASEMVLPYEVTGFSTLSNGSLGIFSREGIIQLAGTSSSDWVANNMEEYSNNAGAIPDTIQNMGNKTFFLDSRGITELGASDTSSDFYDSLISHAVDDRFRDKWTNAICACVVRAKGQYRLFFNDGSGLIMTVINNQIMFTEIELPDRIQCIVSSEDSDGSEVIYFGSDDGYVRQMERGKHFDIANIRCSIETAPIHCGEKGFVKRFRRLKFDSSPVGLTSLSVTPIFNLDNTGMPVAGTPDYFGGGSLLGSSLLGTSLLGAGLVREGDMDLSDHGEWIRLLFASSDNDEFPWEVDGYTIDYFSGRKRR